MTVSERSATTIGGVPPVLERLRGRLVVSCQAAPGEPLHGPQFTVAMALSALAGGAAGVRVEGVADVAAVRRAVEVPIIGLVKHGREGVYITPTVDDARALAAAGADVVALDGTGRPRADGVPLDRTVAELHAGGVVVMADVSTFEEGLAAAAAGADAVGTTLSGYTEASGRRSGPDLDLVARLASSVTVPVIAEGRIATPAQAAEAVRRGAFAVVVGSAITRPAVIAAGFADALRTVTR